MLSCSCAQARRFCFENVWIREPSCRDFLIDFCSNSFDLDIVSGLTGYGDILSAWGKDLHHLHKLELDGCQATMVALCGYHVPTDIDAFLVAKNHFHELLSLRELYWKQRAKEF
ncbi:hypothetical protein MANES_13G089918v8 [Manihot esculenta]|uniref:Uncharacterized protein n=1 Tax=Manihot esculenta TaxID=3983 RepID=A0ACB7GLU5_MANES|nr:hypothetical protein MANES_13G089918v8 [Manihot esculenta]